MIENQKGCNWTDILIWAHFLSIYNRGRQPWSWRAAGCAAFCFHLKISNRFGPKIQAGVR